MPDPRRTFYLTLLVTLVGLAGATGPAPGPAHGAAAMAASGGASLMTTSARLSLHPWRYRRLHGPERVEVRDGRVRPVATFTLGARTVNVRGRRRVLHEPGTTSPSVSSHTRVRLLARPFTGHVPVRWLRAALRNTRPDVLAVALQYVSGAPTVRTSGGELVSSDADYGPLQSDGTRQEGSDFNDYLGVPWTYGTESDSPERDQHDALDCSGFVRMVMGYRAHVPLGLDTDGVRLPRRAVQMLAGAPGVVTIRDTGGVPSTRRLAPGDLLFFDADTADGTQVDHVAVYLGRDNNNAPRFVSSRKSVNGPTMGDEGGNSLLSGTGTYARTWRAARRL